MDEKNIIFRKKAESSQSNASSNDKESGKNNSSTCTECKNKGSWSEAISALLPYLALAGGSGIGASGILDLFTDKEKKKGMIKTLLGLLLAGAGLYPLISDKVSFGSNNSASANNNSPQPASGNSTSNKT